MKNNYIEFTGEILTGEDVNKEFTNIVNGYLNKGFTISATTMSGTQGEHAKVDLTDGKDVVRVMINNRDRWARGDYLYGLEITAALFKGRCNNNFDTFNTLWNSKGEVIKTVTFYEIGQDKHGYRRYTRQKAFAVEANNKARNRARWYVAYTDETAIKDAAHIKRVVEICKEHKGYKSIQAKDIVEISRINRKNGTMSYMVRFSGTRKPLQFTA